MPNGWDIRREGRAWNHEEMRDRWDRIPEKMEIDQGKLYYEEEDRINLLGVILENVGTDRAVQLGDQRNWRESVRALRDRRFLDDRFNRIMVLLLGLHFLSPVFLIWIIPSSPPSRLVTLLLAGAVSYAVALGVHVFLQD